MPEESPDLGLVKEVLESSRHQSEPKVSNKWVDILEGVALALVAVLTALSGFQAAKWSGLSNQQVSLGLRATVLAQEKATLAGQDRIYDVFAFNDWLEAKADHNEKLANFYERRFRPEYATTFTAWMKLDPLHDRSAPPGPVFMKEYANANTQESARLSGQSKEYFDNAVSMRGTSEEYIRVTLYLATVLLLIAIGQRIQALWPRSVASIFSFILLSLSVYQLLTLPHLW